MHQDEQQLNENEQIADAARELFGPNALRLLHLLALAVNLEIFDSEFEEPGDDPDFDRAMTRALESAFPASEDAYVQDEQDVRMNQSDVATQIVGQIAMAGISEPGKQGSGCFDRTDYRGRGAIAAERAALATSLRDLIPEDVYDALVSEWRRVVGWR